MVECVSLGLGVRNTRRFMVLNPTNVAYEFEWRATPADGKPPEAAFKCATPRGVVAPGRVRPRRQEGPRRHRIGGSTGLGLGVLMMGPGVVALQPVGGHQGAEQPAVAAHGLPSARSQGEPLSSTLTPPA